MAFVLVAPPVRLCTDNAVMVAWTGIERLRLGLADGLDFAPRPRWPRRELPPRLPRRQLRGLREARGAGLAAACAAAQAGAALVLDTHAGVGRYDLKPGRPRAPRNGGAGIGRLLDDPPPVLADYVGLVQSLGLYPGSPAIARALLRPDDRLVCCELHPEDAASLRRHFAAGHPGRGASSRCVGGAWRAAAAEASGAASC